MIGNIRIKLSDLILSFSKALDFINPAMMSHHIRVAIIASEIARHYGMPHNEVANIFVASTLHDIGAFSLKDRLTTLDFEIKNPQSHAEKGYLILKNTGFDLLPDVAKIIRYHHMPWADGRGAYFEGEEVHIGSHIIHLSDRIEVLIDRQKYILNQGREISDIIKAKAGSMFMPDVVKAFEELSQKEYFWLDAASPEVDQIIYDRNVLPDVELNAEGLLKTARLFSHIIDYRSRFTAVHSAGVSAVAALLAQMAGFSDLECEMMRIAGYLHDIGKLAISSEIIEKPARLSDEEFNVMKSHVYHSYRILEAISGLEIINTWASFHHERMDGGGYPFHIRGNELPIGSRIMAVADVFTAITEDRPYRKGMSGENALKVIEDMAKNNSLDKSIVDLASTYFRHLDYVRIEAQLRAGEEYAAVKGLME
ncbi:HD domain-containing protein [hot springs metagenome]|uniref:HD domain-containing protein n=1 Tax=hot springs metagenome TaxID=433727 RepID=A0A5J4L6F5_9ZZZZ